MGNHAQRALLLLAALALVLGAHAKLEVRSTGAPNALVA